MAINASIAGLFDRVFGVKFQPEFADVPAKRRTGDAAGMPLSKMVVGAEYYLPAELRYMDGAEEVVVELPHAVVSIATRKLVIETQMTERVGTVKELVGQEDYMFLVRGFLISEDKDFPEALMAKLVAVYERNEAVQLRCALTDVVLHRKAMGATDMVVVKSLMFPEVVGVKNVKPYQMELVSDSVFSLEVV